MASLQREAKPSEFELRQPIPQLSYQLWEQHIPVRATQGRWEMGPRKDLAVDGGSRHKALELLGETKRGRREVSRAEFGRYPLERKVSPWSLFEFQDRKRRGTSEFPGQAKQVLTDPKPHYGKPAKIPCREHKGQRGARTQSKDSPSLSARRCPQWDTSPLPPHGSTTARPRG